MDIDTYFHRLGVLLKTGFLTVFLGPVVALSVYFDFQFNSNLKEAGKLHLSALAESQRNTVDLFLQERVVNIFSLFHNSDFTVEPSQNDMEHYLQNLRQTSEAFIDVGFCTSEGVQIGYAGPFPHLRGMDYSGEDWFQAVMDRDSPYYISDIYPGLRDKLHFTIAVRQQIDNRPYVMRATLDPDKFYMFLRSMGLGKGVTSALVNREGYYQLVDPDVGKIFEQSPHVPVQRDRAGVEEKQEDGDPYLLAYAWLEEVPWTLLVSQPLRIAYARMYKTRTIMIVSTAMIMLVLSVLVWKITDWLLLRARTIAEARNELHTQLLHASKLAAVGELAAGIAHEVNNPLAMIGASCGVIKDYFDPKLSLEWSPEEIRNELNAIDVAVSRAADITHQLLNFSRKSQPSLVPVNVNELLDNVVNGFKEQEFQVSNIELIRDYETDIPPILLDPDQISQVFLNLVNNAGDAIENGGTITLMTRHNKGWARVSVTDTGTGMTFEELKKIFNPFYTSKEVGRGTGLGLSVSLNIVESLGGRIDVQSIKGKGSSFTVVLPINAS